MVQQLSSEINGAQAKSRNKRSRHRHVNSQNRNQNRKSQNSGWRRQIPSGSVDPITLEPLNDLSYPPFALYAEPPYDIATLGSAGSNGSQGNNDHHHVHMYDGYALAVYLISQLQFIDPLNRRDLTRAELLHLDRYLQRHQKHFPQQQEQKMNVTQAYDAKGNSISRAGAVAATSEGRVVMMQQEAQTIFESLFTHHHDRQRHYRSANNRRRNNNHNNNSNSNNQNSNESRARAATTTPSSNPLTEAYLAHEQLEEETYHQQARSNADPTVDSRRDDSGIDGDEYGILVIDDDINPGLRGALALRPTTASSATIAEKEHLVPQTKAPTLPSFSVWSTGRLQQQRHRGKEPHLPQLPTSRSARTTKMIPKKSAALAKLVVTPPRTSATTGLPWKRPN